MEIIESDLLGFVNKGRKSDQNVPRSSLNRKALNVGAGASGIWEHREETQRPLHETMRLAEAWLMRHAPGGSMPSQTLKHCKIQSRKDAPKMAILEAPCAQNAPGRSTMRLPEALLPRNPTWESSHFWGLTIKYDLFGRFESLIKEVFSEGPLSRDSGEFRDVRASRQSPAREKIKENTTIF